MKQKNGLDKSLKEKNGRNLKGETKEIKKRRRTEVKRNNVRKEKKRKVM